MKNNRNKKKTMIEMEKKFHQNNHGLFFINNKVARKA